MDRQEIDKFLLVLLHPENLLRPGTLRPVQIFFNSPYQGISRLYYHKFLGFSTVSVRTFRLFGRISFGYLAFLKNKPMHLQPQAHGFCTTL